MPFRVFSTGEVLTANNVNTYLAQQAISVVTSGTRPGSPVEGMTIYETDTDTYMVWNGSAWLAALDTLWQTYSAAWTATTTNPVIGNGTIVSKYVRQGKICTVEVSITAGSTTTFGSGTYAVSLPFTAASNGITAVGSGYFRDSSAGSAGHFGANCVILSGTTTAVPVGTGSAIVSNTVPFTWATGDSLNLAVAYETV